GALCRSPAPGSRSDRHRHQLCDDRPVPRRPAGLPRSHGNRPRRRPGGCGMMSLADHLIIVPILLPLVTGAVMLLLNERRRVLKGIIGMAATVALLIVSIILLRAADMMPTEAGETAVKVYELGNWPAPFGIVLVLDRLSALMLVLTSVLGIAALLYALA